MLAGAARDLFTNMEQLSTREVFQEARPPMSGPAEEMQPAATIPAWLADTSARRPHAPALLAPGRATLSYGRLVEQISLTREGLRSLGIGRGDRVAMALPDGPETAVAFLGVASFAACAPLNPAHRPSEIEAALTALAPRALLVLRGAPSAARQVAAARGVPLIELATCPDAEAGVFRLDGPTISGKAEAEPPALEDVALLLPTSGTTSRPKLVPLTHSNLWHGSRNVAVALGLTPQDRSLTIAVLYHIHGLHAALLAPLWAGGSVVCTPGFDATRFFEWMDAFSPTWYTAVPPMHQAILQRAGEHLDVIARRRLRCIRSASAAMPTTVLAELERTFGAPVLDSYGITETSTTIVCNPLPPGVRKPGSVGVRVGLEVSVIDELGTPLAAGAVGEVVVRGGAVFGGYLNDPEATARAFIKGWFRETWGPLTRTVTLR
jgi:acyl-CoA synthetase (AMP-forming)/AMP-acid ligase II